MTLHQKKLLEDLFRHEVDIHEQDKARQAIIASSEKEPYFMHIGEYFMWLFYPGNAIKNLLGTLGCDGYVEYRGVYHKIDENGRIQADLPFWWRSSNLK